MSGPGAEPGGTPPPDMGTPTPPSNYSGPTGGGPVPGADKKVLAGILAILFGQFGVHKFILGYQKEGFIMLACTIVGYVTICFGIGVFICSAMGIIGVVEGIIYLTKSDQDFVNTYIVGKKPWF